MSIQDVMNRLSCSEVYAAKVLTSCNNDYEVRRLVAQKEYERSIRKGIYTFGVDSDD